MDPVKGAPYIRSRQAMLRCPECHKATLLCGLQITGTMVDVVVLSQGCLCDPYGDWDDVWEQAHDLLRETDEEGA